MTTLPTMEPHTRAKHLLLKRYLDAWFPILGRRHPRINYLDGFAGPGEYAGGEQGSPLIAVEAAQQHVQRGTLSSTVEINFAFVEANEVYAEHLRGRLQSIEMPASFRVDFTLGSFDVVVTSLLDRLDRERKTLAPTFAFVDPFGFSGIPFKLMTRILRNPRCEVFVNVMVEFINRFLEHPNDNVVRHFPTTFGTQEVLEIPRRQGDRVGQLLDLYKRQLKTVAKFVGRFDMHGRKDQKTYSLFFASNAPKGFEKMKEAMWSVDAAEGERFSDFNPSATLFTLDRLWEELADQFRGRQVSMTEIDRFVIEETDSYLPTHARQLLKSLENQGRITVCCQPGYKRPKGTFKADKVAIQFPS